MSLLLGEIVEALGGQLHGDAAVRIERLAPLDSAGPDALSFVSNPRYRAQLPGSRAACVIVSPELAAEAAARGAYIVAPDPYLYLARLTQLWKARRPSSAAPRVHPSAVIAAGAFIAEDARIGALCVVEDGARIGSGTELKARVFVGAGSVIGARCIVHPGAVIGADGFGFAPRSDGWEKIEQLGAVRIGDDVEIGANTCIDRGALDDTVVEDGVKLDNLVQIGHNARIGRHTAIAGLAGVAGSAIVGAHCTIGGRAGIAGHITLADHVHIDAASIVTHSVSEPGHYTGFFPLDDNAAWEKNAASLRQLHSLRARIRALEQHQEGDAEP